MELSFLDIDIRDICEKQEIATNKYGHEVAQVLQSRLADLYSITTINEMPVGNLEEISSDPPIYKIDLTDSFRLIFCINHPKRKGDIDLENVMRIKVHKIENTNA